MGTSQISRVQVIGVIKRAAVLLRGMPADEKEPVARALAQACGELGVTPAQFDAAINTTPELDELKTTAVREALSGPTDPGPNAAISREAATGQPGDTAVGPGAPGANGI